MATAFPFPAFAAEKPAKLKAEDILSKHLEALGTTEARTRVNSRMVNGTVEFNPRSKAQLHLEGKAQVLSQGAKFKTAFTFASKEYPGEQFVFDGKSVAIAAIDPKNRSRLGGFVFAVPEIVEGGLWAGELGTDWALLDLQNSGAKLKSDGIKKIDGRELYQLIYTPKKHNSQLVIHLYFEPDSFRHVMTSYRLSLSGQSRGEAAAGGSGQAGGEQPGEFGEMGTIVEERFSEFQTVDGITLPGKWEIRLGSEPKNKDSDYVWVVSVPEVKNNPF